MSSFQRRTFGTITNDASVGATAWTNPSNAASSDNSYAVATALGVLGLSNYLKFLNSSYLDGTTLNVGDTINFISWSVERFKSGNPAANVRDYRLFAIEGGTIISANNYADTASDWGTTDTDLATGHNQNTNLPTAATVLASDWGFVFAAQNTNSTAGGTANVDWGYAYIDFTPAGSSPPNNAGTFVRQALNRAANYCFFRAWKPLPSLVYRPRLRPAHFLFQPSWELAL